MAGGVRGRGAYFLSISCVVSVGAGQTPGCTKSQMSDKEEETKAGEGGAPPRLEPQWASEVPLLVGPWHPGVMPSAHGLVQVESPRPAPRRLLPFSCTEWTPFLLRTLQAPRPCLPPPSPTGQGLQPSTRPCCDPRVSHSPPSNTAPSTQPLPCQSPPTVSLLSGHVA